MLARTKLLTFIISSLVIFLIFVTFFGENGYIENRKLMKYSEALEEEIRHKSAMLEMLRSEGKEEIPGTMGEAEVIATYDSSGNDLNDVPTASDIAKCDFRPLPLSLIALLSVLSGAIVTFSSSIISRRRNEKHNN